MVPAFGPSVLPKRIHARLVGVAALIAGCLESAAVWAAPNIAANPTSVDFGLVQTSTSATPVNVVLTNSGTSPGATGVTYTFQPDAGPFTLSNTDASIAAMSSANFDIGCLPLAPGNYTRTLRITWFGGGNTPLDITVHCAAIVVSVPEPGPEAVTEFAFSRLSPNPTSAGTQIEYALPAATRVRIAVFDLEGRRVAVVTDEKRPAGRHHAGWSGRGESGALHPGLYLVRLEAGGWQFTKPLMLIR